MSTAADWRVSNAEFSMPKHFRAASTIGQLPTPPTDGPVLIYTDGSVAKKRFADKIGHLTGWGFLDTNGRYGCGRYPQFVPKAGRSVTATTELRAIWHAIGPILEDQAVTVITDSRDAAITLERWKTGSTEMFAGYTGGTGKKTPTLELLRRTVAAHPANLTIQTVRAHTGDLLNEGADALARLGCRWATENLPADEVTRRAGFQADGFLESWRNRQ